MPAFGSQPLPTQALLLRPSRALPYRLHTSANIDLANGQAWLTFSNTGAQGAVFHVYDELNLSRRPRRCAVEAGKQLADAWQAVADNDGQYSLWVLGPNGYHRHFKGDMQALASGPNPEIRIDYDPPGHALHVSLMNRGDAPAQFTVKANAYRSDGPWSYAVAPGMQVAPRWSRADTHRWYDFTVTLGEYFERRFAGRLENGQDGVSDPAMGDAGV